MSDSAAAPSRALLPALAACALALAGPFAWTALMDRPAIRTTALPAFVLFASALALAVHAFLRDRRWFVRALLVLPLVITAGFTHMFVVQLALPPSRTFTDLEQLSFALLDQDGKSVSLPDPAVKGPTLAVFFRGHW